MRQHHPQGEAPDGPRPILHDPPIQRKAPFRRFFVSAVQVVQVRLNRPSPPFPNLNTPGTQAMIALADNDNVYLQGENHVLNIWHFKQCR